jgi:hypothetical protein
VDDFSHLREDAGLSEMVGHQIPSPSVARKFLNGFHEDAKIETAKQQRIGDQIAYIPEETEALRGLGLVNRELVRELGRRCPEQRIATVDQDATIIESKKQEALRTYEGERGYQPMLAVWAEMNVVLADEFRDGNVPAYDVAVDSRQTGVCGTAGDRDGILLPGRFGEPRKSFDQLAAERKAGRRTAGIHRVCR